MPLNIVVCIKQVPDPDSFDQIVLDRVTGLIDRSKVPSVTNPPDRHALEEALRKREQFGGTVSVVTMGPSHARKCLEEALAMGADRAAILCDPACRGADTLATARLLAAGVKRLGDFDLILCGSETVDGSTGQVPPQLAECLGVAHVTQAVEIQMENEDAARVKRRIEGGHLQILLKLPAVVSVRRSVNRYRLPNALGIVQAAGKEIEKMAGCDCEPFGITPYEMGLAGSPTRVLRVFESGPERTVEMIQGDPLEAAHRLVEKLHGIGLLL